jgi:hypothetical protein
MIGVWTAFRRRDSAIGNLSADDWGMDGVPSGPAAVDSFALYVNGGVKAGQWAGGKPGQFGAGHRPRRAGAAPAEMARVSEPGRTRPSGSASGLSGFVIG